MKNLNQILRHLWRNKFFTSLNIVGLAVGISVCWVIFRLVNYEFSFDKNLPDKEHVYRLVTKFTSEEKSSYSDVLPLAVPPYIQNYVSNSDLTVPIYGKYIREIVIDNEGKRPSIYYTPSHVMAVNPNYFELVSYDWLAGDKNRIFTNPFEIVLTSSRAQKYFPDSDVRALIGQTVMYDTIQYTIAGVVEDLQVASNFSGKEFIEISKEDWSDLTFLGGSTANQLYIKINSESKKSNLLKIINDKTDAEALRWGYPAGQTSYSLVPLADVHFASFMDDYVDKKMLFGMMAIGAFLLGLSVINFVNISTSQIPERAKNIGIRKTMGESSWHLALNFILETAIICLCSFVLAFFLKDLLFSQIKEYVPDSFYFVNDTNQVIAFLLGLMLVLVVLTSVYPIYLSGKVQVVDVLKHKSINHIKFGNLSFKRLLIVLQFVVAQFFVICSILIGIQLRYIMNQDLGFDHDAIVNIQLPNTVRSGLDKDPNTLINALRANPKIQDITLGSLPLGRGFSSASLQRGENPRIQTSGKYVGDRYGRLFNLKLLAGRDLALRDSATGIAITLKAAEMLGFDHAASAIGERIKTNEINQVPREIVGVYDDFNSRTLHSSMEPLSFTATDFNLSLRYMNIKLSQNTKDWPDALHAIEREWKLFYNDSPFDLQFYDEGIEKLYDNERKLAKIINSSAVITVFLGCLGLIGLITITTAQMTKEIGIRKVLGSSVAGIIRLLSIDYVILIVISILIATPVAWWTIHHWLSDFVYKVALSWWMFALPALMTLLIAFFTMFYHALKAAKANPVDSLRNE